jgi:serine/threonine-protein kinase
MMPATAMAEPGLLWRAADEGATDLAAALLASGAAEINWRHPQLGTTALHRATFGGHEELARLLVESGANLNALSRSGATPLIYAALSGEDACAVFLLSANADPSIRLPDGGGTALEIAEANSLGIATTLVRLLRAHMQPVPENAGMLPEDAPTHEPAMVLATAPHTGLQLTELPPDALVAIMDQLPTTTLGRWGRLNRTMLRLQCDNDASLWRRRVAELLQCPSIPLPPGISSWRLVMGALPRDVVAGKVRMVPVPAGKFVCGEQREVRDLSYTYWVDVVPVTCARFAAFAAAQPWNASRGDRNSVQAIARAGHDTPKKPVTMVSWHEAAAFAAWAGMRLPTCTEWEKAVRGTDGRCYPWGDVEYDSPREIHRALQLGSKYDVALKRGPPLSPYGLAKLGRVFEWCEHEPMPEHQHDEDGQMHGVEHSPDEGGGTAIDGTGLHRAPWQVGMCPNRGGSFRHHDLEAFATFAIEYDPPEMKHDDLGFRCCFSFPPTDQHRANSTPV